MDSKLCFLLRLLVCVVGCLFNCAKWLVFCDVLPDVRVRPHQVKGEEAMALPGGRVN